MSSTTRFIGVTGSGVPSTTPQSIRILKGVLDAVRKVTRKQSPSPWRYIRIETREALAKGLVSVERRALGVVTALIFVAVFLGAGFLGGVFFVAIVASSTHHDGASRMVLVHRSDQSRTGYRRPPFSRNSVPPQSDWRSRHV